jgi:cyclopropane-fatty-acyl-phospholipid synthase
MTSPERSGASTKAIDFHYSVGNSFYRLWLDESMTYSGALWGDGDTLEAAQQRKIDYHLDQAGVCEGARVLDIGCGWGSALKRMVAERNVRHAVGLTISNAQAAWLQDLAIPRTEIRCESWAVHDAVEPYDAIISIGAFEHFAKAGLTKSEKLAAYRSFFHRCHGLLRPGGRMSLQTIAYGNISPQNRSAFVEQQIFPESDLPTLAEIAESSAGLFEIGALRNDRLHYLRTAREWLRRLRSRSEEATRLVGQSTAERYQTYLGLFIIGFHTGSMHLLRVTLIRNEKPQIC